MKAVGYTKPLPIDDPQALEDLDLPEPMLSSPHDLLVEVKAVSVNPVDTKQRGRIAPQEGGFKILGFDAAGVVRSVGGVGSILVQLARRLTGLTIIGTASRPETRQWVEQLGAHHVIDHSKSLVEELKRIGIPQVFYAAGLTHTSDHYPQIAEALLPQGKFCLIDNFGHNDISLLRTRSISFHWEYMFTRPLYQTPDMIAQHHMLEELAGLVDSGAVRTTMTEDLGPINAANMKDAHRRVESNRTIGKIVLSGW